MKIRRSAIHVAIAVAGVLVLSGRTEAADRQIRPFIGVTFGGNTTFVDLEKAAGNVHLAVGASVALLGEMFGLEIDAANAPGFFESGDKHLVLSSRVTTLSG